MQPEQAMIQLFNRISEIVGDGVSPEKMERYEKYVLSIVRNKKPVTYTLLKRAAFTAVSIALLFGIWAVLFLMDEKPILFSVGKDNWAGVVNKWMSIDADEKTPLRFDQGSTFLVYPKSMVRVLESNEKSVSIDLKKGSLLVDIHGNGTTRWSVSAGPYRVTVLGTKFMVAWNSKEQILDVKVNQGTVLVQGTEIGSNGIQIEKGHHFRADRRTGLLAIKTVNSDYYDPKAIALVSTDADWDKESRSLNTTQDPMHSSGSPSSSENFKMNETSSVLHTDKPKAGSPKTKWLLQYNLGRYDLAVKEAQKLGIEKLLSTLDVNTLWKLIYAARASGQDEVAMEALTACRSRFKNDKKARTAAFLFGKIYFDQKRDLLSASKWFSRYLSEDPDGPLAEEALGRLVVVFEQLGRMIDAKDKAQSYLQKYPHGSFEENARLVLKK